MKEILIIEDNLEVRENLEEILELSGYDVITAEDGKVGVKKALASPPALILCDVMMPRVTGLELFDHVVRDNPVLADRFVFMTGGVLLDQEQQVLLDAYALKGAVLSKPFEMNELVQVLSQRIHPH